MTNPLRTSAPWSRPSLARRPSPSLASLDLSSSLLAIVICFFLILLFGIFSDEIWHWFTIPIFLSGCLVLPDAVKWFRGKLDFFDPIGIMGILLTHFFFIAPLLHVAWDRWMNYPDPPQDWRPWLGSMALLNTIGLILYRLSIMWFRRSPPSSPASAPRRWTPNPRLYPILLMIFLVVTFSLQILVFVRAGGIFSYMQAFTEESTAAFEGMGIMFMFSESFPILLLFLLVFFAERLKGRKPWILILSFLLVFFVTRMFFGGLRGSRSNTIWALFWAVGVVHFRLRPMTRTLSFFGILFLIFFMYFYSFYKGHGVRAFEAFDNRAVWEEIREQSVKVDFILLNDLARSDLQAFLFYRLMQSDRDYQYAWGRTYLGAAVILWPKQVWPSWFPPRPANKGKEGTELQYGTGTYDLGVFSSSRTYGMVGEFMMNFPPWFFPLAFLLLGWLVGRVSRLIHALPRGDLRFLIVPFLVNFCFTFLSGDSDNCVFFFIKNGAVPFFVIWFGSTKLSLQPQPQPLLALSRRAA